MHVSAATSTYNVCNDIISAWGNYANILNDQGNVQEAEQAYRNALVHRSNMADTHYNL